MLLVEAPRLPLELARRQVLLEAAGLVVEDEEQRLGIQLLVEGGRVKDGGPLQQQGREGGGSAGRVRPSICWRASHASRG